MSEIINKLIPQCPCEGADREASGRSGSWWRH